MITHTTEFKNDKTVVTLYRNFELLGTITLYASKNLAYFVNPSDIWKDTSKHQNLKSAYKALTSS